MPVVCRYLAVLLLASLSIMGRQVQPSPPEKDRIDFIPVDMGQEGSYRGRLQFLGGWELRGRDPKFGGLSAIALDNDNILTAISDTGHHARFPLPKEGVRSVSAMLRPLPDDLGGRHGYLDRDAEGLDYDPAGRKWWISYEGRHAVRRFDDSLSHLASTARLASMRGWPANAGGEAIARLRDGRFLLFSEGAGDVESGYAALLFAGDPVNLDKEPVMFRYRPAKNFHVTDAKQLPDGRVILLERRFSLPFRFSAQLSLLDPLDILPGKLVEGQPLGALFPDRLVDNMEGIAVELDGDNVIFWIISDDNFTILQRTILMKFRLMPDAKKPAAGPAPGFQSLG